MGTKELRKRETWQDASGEKAGVAEKNFYNIFMKEFEGSDLRIRSKPKEWGGPHSLDNGKALVRCSVGPL
jgi:hypothetical protein